jgi:hypothetical protein
LTVLALIGKVEDMTRSRRWIVIAIASVAGLLLMLVFSVREPRYQGGVATGFLLLLANCGGFR